MTSLRVFALALLASFFTAATAHAALVTASQSATFAFDTSGLGASFTIGGGTYNCNVSCPSGTAGPEALADGATMGFDFGSSGGASDIASRYFTNLFGFDIDNASGGIFKPSSIAVAGPLTTLFITVLFVDDEFGIDTLSIFGDNFSIEGRLVEAEIPLPAALPMFLAGLAGFGFVSRRRKKAAA